MDPDDTAVGVTVTFNEANAPRRVAFDRDGPIHFDTARGTVTFTLQVNVALQARFPSNPIQWVDDSVRLNPIDPPSTAKVTRSATTTTVQIEALPGTQTYSFFVIVQTSDGRFFGTDPTIVTMRPGSGN